MLVKEQNAIQKQWTSDRISIGLIYPNTYRVAMTSLGVQLLYFLFNSWDNFVCERIFKPLDQKVIPYSLENQRKLLDFDVLAISCQFEHDYLEAIELLNRGNINPDVRKRDDNSPLIIMGGPSPTSNPFPVLFTPDVFFLGDIEPVADEIRVALEKETKKERLEALADISGCMVYNYHYDQTGKWIGEKVESVRTKNLNDAFFPIKQIIPENVKGTKNEPIFGKAFYLETDRGCSERCLFCFVGHCRFPRIGRSLEKLTEIIEQASQVNDFEKVVVYGSAVAQSGIIDKLIEFIVSKGYEVSCSSFRADYLTEELLVNLRKGKQRTLSLAPETGDEKQRYAINKQMSDEKIFSALKLAWDAGFRRLKMYMIYGFPCEKEDVKHNSFEFVKEIRKKHFPTGRISISMNQFITKANTPFQFAPMLGVRDSKEEQKWYKSNFYQLKNIELSFYAPEWAIIQRILSLRDHNYFPILNQVASISNKVGNWKRILKINNSSLDYEASWQYETDSILPWDNITQPLEKKILVKSFQRYLSKMQC
ncbi:MAG: radical SAM protein [Candidatus Heimdallarchaeota archaeon]|nr:radical SAM protein [Candidatus Heimdallarchaeota archaeon]